MSERCWKYKGVHTGDQSTVIAACDRANGLSRLEKLASPGRCAESCAVSDSPLATRHASARHGRQGGKVPSTGIRESRCCPRKTVVSGRHFLKTTRTPCSLLRHQDVGIDPWSLSCRSPRCRFPCSWVEATACVLPLFYSVSTPDIQPQPYRIQLIWTWISHGLNTHGSATNCLSFRFSSSKVRSRRSPAMPSPANRFFHR